MLLFDLLNGTFFVKGNLLVILHFECDLLEGKRVPFILHFSGGAVRNSLLNIIFFIIYLVNERIVH